MFVIINKDGIMVNICVNMCEWAYTKLGNGLNQAKKRAKTSQMQT